MAQLLFGDPMEAADVNLRNELRWDAPAWKTRRGGCKLGHLHLWCPKESFAKLVYNIHNYMVYGCLWLIYVYLYGLWTQLITEAGKHHQQPYIIGIWNSYSRLNMKDKHHAFSRRWSSSRIWARYTDHSQILDMNFWGNSRACHVWHVSHV